MNPNESLERVLLRQAVEADREALEKAVGHLRQAVRRDLDVGRRVTPHRYGWLAGGFFVGLLWGLRRSRNI